MNTMKIHTKRIVRHSWVGRFSDGQSPEQFVSVDRLADRILPFAVAEFVAREIFRDEGENLKFGRESCRRRLDRHCDEAGHRKRRETISREN